MGNAIPKQVPTTSKHYFWQFGLPISRLFAASQSTDGKQPVSADKQQQGIIHLSFSIKCSKRSFFVGIEANHQTLQLLIRKFLLEKTM